MMRHKLRRRHRSILDILFRESSIHSDSGSKECGESAVTNSHALSSDEETAQLLKVDSLPYARRMRRHSSPILNQKGNVRAHKGYQSNFEREEDRNRGERQRIKRWAEGAQRFTSLHEAIAETADKDIGYQGSFFTTSKRKKSATLPQSKIYLRNQLVHSASDQTFPERKDVQPTSEKGEDETLRSFKGTLRRRNDYVDERVPRCDISNPGISEITDKDRDIGYWRSDLRTEMNRIHTTFEHLFCHQLVRLTADQTFSQHKGVQSSSKKRADGTDGKRQRVADEECTIAFKRVKILKGIDRGNKLTVRKSIKHREKLQSLQEMEEDKLTKLGSPLKRFLCNKNFSLGKGSNGTSVYLGILEDGSEVAVKRMLIESCEDAAENEMKILNYMKKNKSPFIVNYRHFLKDNTFLYLIVDLCEQTLHQHVHSKNIGYLRIHGRRMIKEVLTGLKFLHDRGILHRDLKPSNVLVDVDGHMRLADFGISRVLNEDETTILTDTKGTEGWMAAEVIENMSKKMKGRFKKKSDIQSAGMIAFFILTKGEHPFGCTLYDRMANIVKGNPVDLNKLDNIDARQFVSRLISRKIHDRPTAQEAMLLPFLNGI